MSAGIQIVNDFGTVLIDENYKNYRFVRKGVATVGPNGAGVRIEYSGTKPIIALQPPKGTTDFLALGEVYKPTFGGNDYVAEITVSTFTGFSFNYYIFDIVPDDLANGGLVQVRDGNNKITFDSNQLYLKLIDFSVGHVRNRILPNVEEAAIIVTPGTNQFGDNGSITFYLSGVYWDGNHLISSDIPVGYVDTSDGGQNSNQNPSFEYVRVTMFIDVTGL